MQEYNKIDQYMHLLCQVIAKTNRTFVTAEPDDSHTNLYFDPVGDRIVGRWFECEGKQLLLSLNLNSFKIEALNRYFQSIFSAEVIGNTMDEIEMKVQQELQARGLSVEGFKNPMPYEIPAYSSTQEIFSKILEKDLTEWKHYRRLANLTCYAFLGYVQCTTSEVRIWSHHFDTGFYAYIHDDLMVGFGLAMQDKLVDSPYFYMFAVKKSKPLVYEQLPQSENWSWLLDDNWQGAILPISKLEDLDNDHSIKILNEYFKIVLNWFLSQ